MRDMNKIFPILAALLICLHPVMAQVRVSKGGGQKSSIDLSGFTAGGGPAQIFRRTLDADLMRFGWFVSAPAGQGEFNVLGSAEGQGVVEVQCRVFSRATGQTKLSKSYNADASGVRRLAHKVADDIVEALTGRKGIASGRLALVGNRTGKKEIYLCDADGQGLIQLTRDNSVSIGPNWGPGGKELVYTSYLKGYPDVYTIELASGSRRRIAGFPGLNTGGAFSPDGRDMALILSKDGNPELYVKNLSSGALTRLTNTKRSAEASPSWSPDGRQIVYVSDQSGAPQLWIISRGGGAPRRLTSRGSQNVAPDWGPNGLVAYASLTGGKFQVCVTDPASGETKQISTGWVDWEDPTWAPDGRHVVCARTESYRSKLYLLDMMGDPPLALTDYQGDWYSPAWSR
jgi:TolB protein